MSTADLMMQYTSPRSRLTVFFRYILAIPHLLIAQVWGYLIDLLTFFQWWIILFTGKRNQGIWNMQRSWLAYASRVYSYYTLMYDKWPNIGAEPNGEPVALAFTYEASANRLTNFFRMIMIIPAAIVAAVVGIGFIVCMVLSWIIIVITGNHPQGMWGFMLKFHRFMTRFVSYTMMMTDTYPKYGA